MLIHRLKEARMKKRLSQERLGIMAGIDEATASARMNQYEKGIHVPDFDLMCRIGTILDVPACYFYTIEDDLAKMIIQYQNNKNVINKINNKM